MTPKRIAELRKLAEDCKAHIWPAADAACNAVPELLDELEALMAANRAHEDYAVAAQERIAQSRQTADFERDRFEKVSVQRDGLAAQVMRLREVLEVAEAQFRDESANVFGHARIRTDMNRLVVTQTIRASLADTEAAATAWLQRVPGTSCPVLYRRRDLGPWLPEDEPEAAGEWWSEQLQETKEETG